MASSPRSRRPGRRSPGTTWRRPARVTRPAPGRNPPSRVTGSITLVRRSRSAVRPPRGPGDGRSGGRPRARAARPSLRPRGVTGATPSSWRIHLPRTGPGAGTGGCAERSAELTTALRRHAQHPPTPAPAPQSRRPSPPKARSSNGPRAPRPQETGASARPDAAVLAKLRGGGPRGRGSAASGVWGRAGGVHYGGAVRAEVDAPGGARRCRRRRGGGCPVRLFPVHARGTRPAPGPAGAAAGLRSPTDHALPGGDQRPPRPGAPAAADPASARGSRRGAAAVDRPVAVAPRHRRGGVAAGAESGRDPDDAAVLASLAELERAAAHQARLACLAAPAERTGLLGSITAARATHAEVLTWSD